MVSVRVHVLGSLSLLSELEGGLEWKNSGLDFLCHICENRVPHLTVEKEAEMACATFGGPKSTRGLGDNGGPEMSSRKTLTISLIYAEAGSWRSVSLWAWSCMVRNEPAAKRAFSRDFFEFLS